MERLYAQQLASFNLQPSRTGLLMQLLGAFTSVDVAMLSFVLDRIKLHRVPGGGVVAARTAIRYAPAPRPRPHASKLTIAAALVAAICITAIWLIPKNVAYAPNPTPVPGPDAHHVSRGQCGRTGHRHLLRVRRRLWRNGLYCRVFGAYQHGPSSGADRRTLQLPWQAEQGVVNLGEVLPYAAMGTFVKTVSEGVHNEQHDIGLIVLDRDNVPRSSAIATTLPITGVTSELTTGQELCKLGMGSVEAECGQIFDVTERKVSFAAGGQRGDSGGPVYLMQHDGTVTAVSIDIRGSNPATPKAGCLAPAKYSIAELVQPWLDRWQLTAVTAQSAGPRLRTPYRLRSGPLTVIAAKSAKNTAAGRPLTTLSRTRTCAPTANTKYSVSIAVVSRAKAGNRTTDASPTAATALTTGNTGRMFSGTPTSSRVFLTGATWTPHATASAAWNTARAA